MSSQSEIPIRTPPPLNDVEGIYWELKRGVRIPIIRRPSSSFECGQEARLRGKLVICIRRKGHPVAINYGHSNGYTEWCF